MIYTPTPSVRRNIRLMIILACLVGLVFIANAVVSAYLLRENTIKARMNQLSNLTVVLAEHTSQTIFSANTALQSIVDVLRLSKINNEQEYINFTSSPRQYDLLLDKTKSNSIIDVATFVDARGHVVNFSRSYPPPQIDLSDRDYFQWLSTHNDPKTFYSVPVQNKGNGKWVFYLAKRINNSNGEFLGLVLVGVSVEVFSSLYQQIGMSMGEGSSVILYRDDRRLLTRWPYVDNMIGKVNNNGVMMTSLDKKTDGGVVITDAPGFNMNNAPIERMVSFRRVENYPLIVGATASKKLYLSNWYASLWGILYTTSLSIILLVVATFLLLRAYMKNAKAQYFAHHDALTQLPNRLLFSDRLQQAISLTKRNNSKLAVLFVDLDNLKSINDHCGHLAGDALLIEVALRMKACIRDSDTLCRIGGDEFIILLSGLETQADSVSVANKLLKVISEPCKFEDRTLVTSASIGIAIYPDHGVNEADLINHADVAMYEAKANGKNTIQVYGDGTLSQAVQSLY